MQRIGAAGTVSGIGKGTGARLRPLNATTLFRSMERLVDFEFEVTRYTVWRQEEWGFFVSVAPSDGDSVNLDVDFMHREIQGVLSPRRFPLTSEEGVCLQMERLDGSEEEVTVWLARKGGETAVLGFELPDGVQMELMEENRDPAAG